MGLVWMGSEEFYHFLLFFFVFLRFSSLFFTFLRFLRFSLILSEDNGKRLQFTANMGNFTPTSSAPTLHETYGNHKNDENAKRGRTSTNKSLRVECWISGDHANHRNDENYGNLGCKPRVPQTTGLQKNVRTCRVE